MTVSSRRLRISWKWSLRASASRWKGISEFSEYVSNYITCLILNAISLMVSFLVIYIILRIIGCMLDMLSRIPIVNGLNKAGGFVFGLLYCGGY